MKLPPIAYAATFAAAVAGIAPASDHISISPAFAAMSGQHLSKGDCLTRVEMMTQLSSEGQYPLIIQDIIAYSAQNGDRVLKREVFSSNLNLLKGLHLEVTGGNYCVTGLLINIKLFNSLSGNFDKKAYSRPASRKEDGTLNNSLDKGYASRNYVPLMQATSVLSGNILTVAGQPDGTKLGAVFLSSQNGYLNSDGRYDVTNVSYGKLAIDNLKIQASPKH